MAMHTAGAKARVFIRYSALTVTVAVMDVADSAPPIIFRYCGYFIKCAISSELRVSSMLY